MRRFLYILFCFVLFSSCSDKVELGDDQAKTFNKFYGNSGTDEACEIRELVDGSFMIFGSVQTAGKGTDMVLIKTDKFGNEQWTKTYGRNTDDKGGSFDISNNGNIIMVGTSVNANTNEGDINHTDILMVEVDQSGTELRRKVFEGAEYIDNEEGKCILYDKSSLGGYVIAGSSDKIINATDPQNGLVVTNNKFVKNFFFIRVFEENGEQIIKVSNSGTEGDDEILSGVLLGNEDNYFLFTGLKTVDDIRRPVTVIISNRNESAQSEGSEVIDNLPGPGSGNKIIKTNNEFAITGTFQSGSNDVIFIKKLNSTGELLDINAPIILTRNGSVRSYGLSFKASNGNFLIGGSTNISTGGGFDHYIAEISSEGTVLWEESFGGSGTEESLAITTTNDGGYVLAGYSDFEGNSLINVIKTDNLGKLNP